MNRAGKSLGLSGLLLLMLLVGCAENPQPLSPELEAQRQSAMARGGRLYDNWFAEKQAGAPATSHRLYPTQGSYRGSITWRCSSCHGWDGYGRNGVFRSGPDYTFIKGIEDVDALSDAQVRQTLQQEHRFNALLLPQDEDDLIRFMREGQINMRRYIDPSNGRLRRGDAQQGAAHYQALCQSCHGERGMLSASAPLGLVAQRNPWRTLHRILNGSPGVSGKPFMRPYGEQVVADLLAYLASLPNQR
ncbi:cytochrome c, class I [Magnetococcus marinus MC-1]|uniref:Cytochrome c, class I n=1 Tax=Magnetococcus marinus (strain ATCC BAA-1437 / JCM 17883 / MC-1) TaxID=156889 RepID=A0L539_MAGMM|nr:cytochrome c [Magnetococcus marinus]ABK43082.1 cytochrome c, class I [Magnetococcus marinus MC-1]